MRRTNHPRGRHALFPMSVFCSLVLAPGCGDSGAAAQELATIGVNNVKKTAGPCTLFVDDKLECSGAVSRTLDDIRDLVASRQDVCALSKAGGIRCFDNQGGTDNEVARDAPLGTGNSHLVAGDAHFCALRAGKARCWGRGSDWIEGLAGIIGKSNVGDIRAAGKTTCLQQINGDYCNKTIFCSDGRKKEERIVTRGAVSECVRASMKIEKGDIVLWAKVEGLKVF